MAASFSVVGDAKEMHPIVRDEVYRIGYEAIRNALVHSAATRLEVELRYAQDLTVRVSDNGIGIDPAVLDKGKDGHFGLPGMRERAARIGGKFTLVSSACFRNGDHDSCARKYRLQKGTQVLICTQSDHPKVA